MISTEAIIVAGAVAATLFFDPLGAYLSVIPPAAVLAVEGAVAGYVAPMVTMKSEIAGTAKMSAMAGGLAGAVAGLVTPDPTMRALIGGGIFLAHPMIMGSL